MNATPLRRSFVATEARREEVPLLVGLTGPSGSGKTFSALRLAKGIQEVYGGDIYGIDTESRRMLHYADKFTFKHVPFGAPFGSLDYLEAIRFAVGQGAGVIVIDSCSHEHDGPGGLLEQHEAELNRLAGDQEWKRDSMNMMAWQKPKTQRRQMINAITTELQVPIIFCFRAKQTAKPGKIDVLDKSTGEPTGKQRNGVIDMGLTPIAGDEWVFEMTLNALLRPGSRGVPTWESDKPGELQAIKLPEQFLGLAETRRALNEAVGRSLAKWAKGDAGTPATTQTKPGERYSATATKSDAERGSPTDEGDGNPEVEHDARRATARPPVETLEDRAAKFVADIKEHTDQRALDRFWEVDSKDLRDKLEDQRPEDLFPMVDRARRAQAQKIAGMHPDAR